MLLLLQFSTDFDSGWFVLWNWVLCVGVLQSITSDPEMSYCVIDTLVLCYELVKLLVFTHGSVVVLTQATQSIEIKWE